MVHSSNSSNKKREHERVKERRSLREHKAMDERRELETTDVQHVELGEDKNISGNQDKSDMRDFSKLAYVD